MRFIKIVFIAAITILLTVVTQIGGVVYLISLLTHTSIERRVNNYLISFVSKLCSFGLLYFIFTLALVPLLAKPFGRVSLPLVASNNLQPANVITCLLNRNYVRPQLRDIAYEVGNKLNAKYPGAKINYLDASFPFFNGFRLLPHLGHSDGRKLDLSFQYNNSQSRKITNEVPSFIGYGICEEPTAGEEDMPAYCDRMGAWQYSLLQKIVSQESKSQFQFDNSRNRDMVNFFAANQTIARIYIEPHLKMRLGLTSPKIKFHGCKAVRHDDHLHVQIDW